MRWLDPRIHASEEDKLQVRQIANNRAIVPPPRLL
jgi:hypothetical protein